jgi:hypothetical protein
VITIPPGTRAMLIRRGNMEIVHPIEDSVYRNLPTAGLVSYLLPAFVRQQVSAPGRASDPLELDDTPVGLRVIGRDSPLIPELPLSMQTEGLWEIRELPVQAQNEATARLPVCAFELIDIERPSLIFLAHAGQPA